MIGALKENSMKLEVYFRVIPEDKNEESSKWQYVGITQPVILKKFAVDHLYQGISDHMLHFFYSEAFDAHVKNVANLSTSMTYGAVCMSDVPLEDFEKDIY